MISNIIICCGQWPHYTHNSTEGTIKRKTYIYVYVFCLNRTRGLFCQRKKGDQQDDDARLGDDDGRCCCDGGNTFYMHTSTTRYITIVCTFGCFGW